MRLITVRGFSQTIFTTILLVILFLFSVPLVQAVPSSLYVGIFSEYSLSQEVSENPDLGVYGQYNNRIFLFERDYLSLTGSASLSGLLDSVEDSEFIEAVYVKNFSNLNVSAAASMTHSLSRSLIMPSWEVGFEGKQQRKVLIPFLSYGGSFRYLTNSNEDILSHSASLGLSYSPRLERSYQTWIDLIYDNYTDSPRTDFTTGLVYEMSGFLGYLSTWETLTALYYQNSTEETEREIQGSFEGNISWSPTRGVYLAFAPEFVLSRSLAENTWTFTSRVSSSVDFIITDNLFAYLSVNLSLYDPDRDLLIVSGGIDVSIL